MYHGRVCTGTDMNVRRKDGNVGLYLAYIVTTTIPRGTYLPISLYSESLDLLSRHSINGDFNLFWSHTATGGDELPANVFCNSQRCP